jgi:hypothetical protein
MDASVQGRLDAFEAVVVAEELRADRARALEIENLTLAVEAAEKAGMGGADIEGARALLAQLMTPDPTDTVRADGDADIEARHTGAADVIDHTTTSVVLGVGDAFCLDLPADPCVACTASLRRCSSSC